MMTMKDDGDEADRDRSSFFRVDRSAVDLAHPETIGKAFMRCLERTRQVESRNGIVVAVIGLALFGPSLFRFSEFGNAFEAVAQSETKPVASAENAAKSRSIDVENTHSTAAVLDLNGDGRIDVLCGERWYSSPGWRPQPSPLPTGFLRNKAASLPIGFADSKLAGLITWSEDQPGWRWAVWPTDRIDAVVTGDGDSDGRWSGLVVTRGAASNNLVVIGVGVNAARRWDVAVTPVGLSASASELPSQLAGRVLTMADVNHDGHADVVGQRGWAAASSDGNAAAWTFHPSWSLPADVAQAAVVFDADGDRRPRLVFARNQRAGVYALQPKKEDVSSSWDPQPIDTAWSAAGGLQRVTMTDGRTAIVTGRPVPAVQATVKEPWQPGLVVLYRPQSGSELWSRTVLSSAGTAGWSAQSVVTDLDSDGQIDLILPGAAGLERIELTRSAWDASVAGQSGEADSGKAAANESAAATAAFLDDLHVPAARYPSQQSLREYLSANGELQPIKSARDWGIRRAHHRAGMQLVMGRFPDPSRRVALEVELEPVEQGDGYRRQRLTYRPEPSDRVPALLLVPAGTPPSEGWPAMLCLHQTNGSLGKLEPAGLGGLPNLKYALDLVQRGYVCLVPDYPSFGEYPYDFQKQGAHYISGSMKAIWNNVRAVDLLEQLEMVDADRIGVIGHSLGGHNALFTAVFDERLRAIIPSCGFTPFHDYYGGKIGGWTSDRYMPRIRDVYMNNADSMPFDFYGVLGALATRGLYSNSPVGDSNFDVTGVRKALAEASWLGQELSLPGEQLVVNTPDAGHDFPEEIRQAAYEWLAQEWQRQAGGE
jgi:dienelactone hydrolase